ncbi:hypothetical protein ASC77_09635 [Nocardioides sp. Root1257]|uniref:hypothetical protein n=1 Tax=unclassified Nocardioides TaxID=2615069 RepID=UPI0006FE367B|nr:MULTISPECIES: hypothetical protein [unclassified Nocardioides]KQW48966.1 hypothetical protein ASC77_09635 [Nocardioides sp. Root1257]KRC48140.1 hypothetical protein ASE24_09640 [Nocardioides sp. Root224]
MSNNASTYGDRTSNIGEDAGANRSFPPPRSRADDGQDGSQAAARLLAMTARETDQWRSEARDEAASIVAAAREESAELVRAAKAEAERLVSSARETAAQTTNDARVEEYRVREATTELRNRVNEEVAQLQQMATQHREQLRQHLTEMLDRVDAAPGDSTQ